MQHILQVKKESLICKKILKLYCLSHTQRYQWMMQTELPQFLKLQQ